ncbi:isoprenoid synthase domain-containing protein [Pyronema domesticum]|uniref:Squalene synthase n=1 Tax=Pyronema omphalodes (strain CBS 100304) TaxID=1076935 RepID=U4LCI5_PYROM|nr:isoprenoid synthase domain-containing protein [Pyronema domesticum]CCX12133.1 Similar to Probable squalene synthase; acc. no. Q7S4Z6 [Pyronema omphalodes CBS 100304]
MKASELIYYAFHPAQLRAMIQWKVWHNPLHERNPEKESASLRKCFEFLDMTSRSFSAVIQELCPELCVPVSLFYLILRGLDTIEDDMTISIEKKEPLLRDFDKILDIDGWNFHDNGPNEKDAPLLRDFQVVIEEFKKISEEHREIIKDITKKMGNGMADYAKDEDHNTQGVKTIYDYDLYCHYVAGLVGEGLTRLFCSSGKANPILLEREYLSNSMGLFLQKTNIIRDYREDLDDGRAFWPKEIWTKHASKFSDFADPKNEEAALNCSSEMVLDALRHADDCLFYLAGIKEQSVFNFAAIPQVMAIATMALVFRNKDVFQKNVKIPKGEACQLMMEVGNLRTVSAIFKKYLRIIHEKNTPKDPNFLAISVACGKVEQWIENVFPTPTDPEIIARQRALAETGETPEEAAANRKELFMLIGAVLVMLFGISFLMVGGAWLMGARFDIAWEELKKTGISSFVEGIQGNVPKAAETTQEVLREL